MEQGPPIPDYDFDYGEYDVPQTSEAERIHITSEPSLEELNIQCETLVLACDKPTSIYAASTFGLGPETLKCTVTCAIKTDDRMQPLEATIELHASSDAKLVICLCLEAIPDSAANYVYQKLSAVTGKSTVLSLVEKPLHTFIAPDYVNATQLIRGINMANAQDLEEPNLCTGLPAAACMRAPFRQSQASALISYKQHGGQVEGLELSTLTALDAVVRQLDAVSKHTVAVETAHATMAQACQQLRRKPKDSMLYL
eukprot:TRINITY_DN8317_c0_g1_i4.p1 TRINITY_DN8317_c0_g1~~TRINITY_DN8317_c0_g1_i4.p1  ORF type:complete len:255 (+),score=32.94 TRINITY_DN8317_c0_g1_i4:45-809(+)